MPILTPRLLASEAVLIAAENEAAAEAFDGHDRPAIVTVDDDTVLEVQSGDAWTFTYRLISLRPLTNREVTRDQAADAVIRGFEAACAEPLCPRHGDPRDTSVMAPEAEPCIR